MISLISCYHIIITVMIAMAHRRDTQIRYFCTRNLWFDDSLRLCLSPLEWAQPRIIIVIIITILFVLRVYYQGILSVSWCGLIFNNVPDIYATDWRAVMITLLVATRVTHSSTSPEEFQSRLNWSRWGHHQASSLTPCTPWWPSHRCWRAISRQVVASASVRATWVCILINQCLVGDCF